LEFYFYKWYLLDIELELSKNLGWWPELNQDDLLVIYLYIWDSKTPLILVVYIYIWGNGTE